MAASVGPYGASLADGSEYTGDYGLDVAQLREWHRPRLQALAAAAPDVIAVETVPSLAELEAVCRELDGLGIPAWVSVTIADGGCGPASRSRRRSRSPGRPRGRRGRRELLRCSRGQRCARRSGGTASPESCTPTAASSGTQTRASGRARHPPSPSSAASWVAGGARLVGGCCRVGPDQIAEIARAVASLRRVARGARTERRPRVAWTRTPGGLMSRILIIGGHGKVALLLAPLLVARGDEVDERHPQPRPRGGGRRDRSGAAWSLTSRRCPSTSWRRSRPAMTPSCGRPVRAAAILRARTRSIATPRSGRWMPRPSAGCRRYVMVSYFGARADHGVASDNSFFAYAEAKAAADDHLRGERPGVDRARPELPDARRAHRPHRRDRDASRAR